MRMLNAKYGLGGYDTTKGDVYNYEILTRNTHPQHVVEEMRLAEMGG